MLIELSVEDFAVIERIRLPFESRFCVLTGETGAGKSLLIDAIGLVLGERSDVSIVRSGAERAVVSAVFDISDTSALKPLLEELGIEIEDNLLLINREVSAGGRSISRINGRPIPAASLKRIGDALVDLHGQHEHQSLLHPERHVEFLDAWLGKDAQTHRASIASQVEQLNAMQRELDLLGTQSRDREHLIELYKFQVEEIQGARLSPDEEEALAFEQIRLAHAEKLYASTSKARTILGVAEQSARDRLSDALANIEDAAAIDTSLAPTVELIKTALYSAEEAVAQLRQYTETIEFSPERLEEINARLDTIKKLMRKYGKTIEEVIAFGVEVEQKLVNLTHFEERSEELKATMTDTRQKLKDDAAKLTAMRKKGAEGFGLQVEGQIRQLAMERAEFSVSITPKPIDTTGGDKVEFFIAPNPGEPPRPLAKIASGGEISRVMLAIKCVMAGNAQIPTLIFDEVDSGLGGRTAAVVGRKLAELSQYAQILCITHLPQIASQGDAHVRLEKLIRDGHTQVHATPVAGEERVGEIARMIGGEKLTDSALEHARQMLGTT